MKHPGRPAGGKTPRLKPLKQALLRGETHAGPVPLAPLLQRSWQRSQEAGLTPAGLGSAGPHASAVQLARARERHRELIDQARPVLEFLFEQTRGTDSVVLLADAAGRRTRIFTENPADGVRIDNRVILDETLCNGWRDRLQVSVDGDTLTLAGHYSAQCGEKTLHLSPWPADRQVERLFRALWRELGGRFAGRVREGEIPADARLLLTHESPPLAGIVRDINKWSNNVTARQIFLSLAGTRPASPEAAREAVGRWLTDKGIAGSVLDNGSGLSQAERLSAEGLGRLLLAAWHSPVMPELAASLPIAGTDGTLKTRLQDGRATGRAHLKTGYLNGVRAIAGYVLDTSGQRWVVVGFLNDPRMKNGAAPLDALVRWVAER